MSGLAQRVGCATFHFRLVLGAQVDRGILELQMDGEDMYNQYAGLARNDARIEGLRIAEDCGSFVDGMKGRTQCLSRALCKWH